MDAQFKSKLRIQIETYLININEEMFAISDELARAFTSGDQENLALKLKDFETRKTTLVKKISSMVS
jgi:hypothetical protein